MEEVFTERFSDIDFKFYMLRQVVNRAKEAKQMGWTNPNDLYPYLVRRADKITQEIEELIEDMK